MKERQVTVIEHPLIQHKLTIMRNKDTSAAKFRTLMHEISILLAYEVTRDLETELVNIETPIASIQSPVLKGKRVVFVSILRAGQGLLNGMLELMPTACVGHIGLYRNPKTLEAVEYYFKLPETVRDHDVIIVDPMLATGNSAIAAVEEIKQLHPKSIKFLCLLTAPEGLASFHEVHPDVPVFTASVDSHLNNQGYIVPGLGDAGDRLFGTKMEH